MSIRHLGETFDIHGGGMDLIFPHHENEIAQSCGATGKEFARYWIHNGFVQINQEKMSKSLGNFFTIREIFEKSEWPEAETGEMLRYFLLATQYRGPLDFSDQSLREAKNAVDGFYDLFMRLGESDTRTTADKDLALTIERCRSAFRDAMDDDFNTPMAIAALQGLRSDVNKLLDHGLSTEWRRTARTEFRSLGNCLGLFQLDRWQFNAPARLKGAHRQAVLEAERQHAQAGKWDPSYHELLSGRSKLPPTERSSAPALTDEEIEKKLVERNEARKQKDFKKADEIRHFLSSCGIIIEDKPNGTSRWKR